MNAKRAFVFFDQNIEIGDIMNRTVLYDNHIERGARMVPFGGWEMPVQYEGIIAEHQHTRQLASLFDICHMGEFIISGPRAMEDIEAILTQNIASLKVDQCRYGYMLDDSGGVLDDLICYRLAEEEYMIVVNAATLERDRDWIKAHLSSNTTFQDVSEGTGKIDIQGPESRRLLDEALGILTPDLKFFHTSKLEIDGVEVLVSRSGYTGEWGYELYLPSEDTERFWNRMLENPSIKPAGLGARDTLRLEVGLPLYGSDLGEERTPIAATRGMFIGKTKQFVGRPAVDRDLSDGCPEYLTALKLEGRRAARPHSKVLCAGEQIGEVTSGSLSPSLGVAIAFAYVRADLTAVGTQLQIEAGRKELEAEVVELPFYKEGSVR